MTLLILGSRAGAGNVYASWWVYLALGIMAFAAVTDIFDGKIARRYKAGTKIGNHVVKHDQGTYVGQCIDPIADKVMHIGAIVALSIAGYLHWAFIVFLVFRELCMVVIGSFVVNDVNIKANMLGKVASAIISCGAILCFFHPMFLKLWQGFTLDWIIVAIGLVLNWSAAIKYGVETFSQIRKNKKAKLENTAADGLEADADMPGNEEKPKDTEENK
jgi:cardiolipin synthase